MSFPGRRSASLPEQNLVVEREAALRATAPGYVFGPMLTAR
jgi:hypothetical protein